MNNDGFGQVGAGQNDLRQGGNDLQHAAQKANNIRDSFMTSTHEKTLYEHIGEEKVRHDDSQKHKNQHLENHHKRNHDSQHGHDNYKHNYEHKQGM